MFYFQNSLLIQHVTFISWLLVKFTSNLWVKIILHQMHTFSYMKCCILSLEVKTYMKPIRNWNNIYRTYKIFHILMYI